MKFLDSRKPMRRDPRENILRLVFLILTFLLVFVLLNQSPWAATAIPRYQGTQNYRETSWVLKKGDRILEEKLELPAFRHLEMGQEYSISADLTYDGSKDQIPSCFFFVDHMFCEAYLDGELLFHYTQEDARKPDSSRSPGNVYASFQLPEDCLGKELKIVFTPALRSMVDFQLPNPSCGDYFSEAVATFRHDLSDNVVAVLFAFLGIASILFSTLVLPSTKYREGLFIGIFAILVSCYSLTESDFAFYVISNPYYTYVLDYTSFTLIPIFLMAFLRERLDQDQKPQAMALIFLGCVLFTVEMILHFTGIMDMREFLPVIHIVYGADFFLFFLMILRMRNRRWKNQLIFQMVPILIGIILDASVYYFHWQLGTSDSGFTSVGIFVFLLGEIYHVWRYSIDVYTLSMQSQEYMQMAYIDPLTGVGNRRAFEAEKDVIAAGKREFESILILSADINNLKPTNDNLGHAAGDFLIRSTAQVLADLTDKRCYCFRMGGDEFLILAYDLEEEKLHGCLEAMEKRVQAINGKSEVKLSFAMGWQIIHNRDVDFALEQADQKMYQNKALMKSGESMKY